MERDPTKRPQLTKSVIPGDAAETSSHPGDSLEIRQDGPDQVAGPKPSLAGQPDSSKRKRASIIVLDPSPLSLLALAGVLDSQGYDCICARDGSAAETSLQMGRQDLLVCDVGDDAPSALGVVESLRSKPGYEGLPAILLADARWAGLEKRTEAMQAATRCLFKPIDPASLMAVVDQTLWMPTLVTAHRRRGSTPQRPGWVTL